eukprot:CAMPEP_0201533732 /NCGR_PEP_ID=MMETSP0161_2-20130828/54131_1 /ASSEMBLY_ACC=CAM_ASM_000251 /TAXON_ID=180227 /ORGANISM="Neoparamoeba aestuarina, Strain SoJaBio B1-5/56/2" /LENGTH=31 /DNA_ID= /DNA_START= /DNA_END= /DNA_ORIENTATION=
MSLRLIGLTREPATETKLFLSSTSSWNILET